MYAQIKKTETLGTVYLKINERTYAQTKPRKKMYVCVDKKNRWFFKIVFSIVEKQNLLLHKYGKKTYNKKYMI